jgi:hypothetical protein
MPDILDVGIDDAVLVLEKWRQAPAGDVAVFVDSGRQNCATVFPVPARVVGTSAKKGNTKWRSRDNHCR